MTRTTVRAAAAVALIAGAPFAWAQDQTTTTATTPAQLIEALRAAGYDLSEITSVNEDGSVSITLPTEVAAELEPDEAEAAEGVADEDVAAAVEAVEPEPEWDSRLTIAFGFSDGNTEQFNFNSIFRTVRENDETRLAFDAAYFFSQEDGNKTENKATVGAVHDWFLDERWFVFAQARWEYDEFRSWRHRASGHAGVGYRLIDEENFKLTPRIGMGAAKEFGSPRNEIIPEGFAGLDMAWQITENQSLTASTYYYPYLNDLPEFRWINTVAWNIKIDQADGLSLSVGLLHEHESDPADDSIESNDFKLFGGLTFDF